MGFKPMAESASESESLSKILVLQNFDGVSISITFTTYYDENYLVVGSTHALHASESESLSGML